MIKTYFGPKIQIQPDELRSYTPDKWSAEEKVDGFWCQIETDHQGLIKSLMGRSGKTFSNDNIDGLIGLKAPIPNGTLIAELEAGTEAGARMNERIGYSRLFIFDVIKMFERDTRTLTYVERRELLEMAFAVQHPRFRLVRRAAGDFGQFFAEVAADGGEGLVLKKKDSKYSSGKTIEWVRCKRYRFVDYVVMSVGKSDGGSDNFQVGLYFGKTLKRVATIKNLPAGMNPHEYVGKVIECIGMEVHQSGALRHGHFKRLRDDKNPHECTFEAAINS